MENNKQNHKNGITLIALVLTIIVLLILAVVAINLALGNNGLLSKANEAKREQIVAKEKDKIIAGYGATLARNNGVYKQEYMQEELEKTNKDKGTEVTVDGKTIKYKHNGYVNKYNIDGGVVKYNEKGVGNLQNNIQADLKVGDTIIYDPTKGVTDTSKLTYTSPKDQNGYGEQKITATSNHKEWVVISTSGGKIKMMSKEVIDGIEGGKDENGNTNGFTLRGGKGYLYAEEELHKMCSIFGHGKGSSKINTKYTVGNPYIEEEEQRTLSGSGARSLILSDIVSVIKGEGQDFTEEEKKSLNSSYKTEVSPEVYYPTKVSTKESRESDDKKSFTQDYYGIHEYEYIKYAKPETEVIRDALKNSIFKDKWYWYGSRCVVAYSAHAHFRVGSVIDSGFVSASHLFWRSSRFRQGEYFFWVWPKTCGLLGLFRPIRKEWLRKWYLGNKIGIKRISGTRDRCVGVARECTLSVPKEFLKSNIKVMIGEL